MEQLHLILEKYPSIYLVSLHSFKHISVDQELDIKCWIGLSCRVSPALFLFAVFNDFAQRVSFYKAKRSIKRCFGKQQHSDHQRGSDKLRETLQGDLHAFRAEYCT